MIQFAQASDHTKYVFLDRDGVINVERGDYTMTIEEWEWMEGSLTSIARLTQAGFGIIVITNQACIHKGRQTHEGLDRLHRYMIDTIREHGGDITAVYYCPHWTPDKCRCRKPEPGLLLDAMEDFGIDPSTTFFIGDAARDIEAGKRAGVKTILISGSKASEHAGTIDADHIVNSLEDAAEIVCASDRSIN